MLGNPEETAYDWRFRLLNIPVRVSPWFWLVMAFLGGGGFSSSSREGTNLAPVVIFIFCAFLSILVHEFGHGLAARAIGREPDEIVLYSFGGLCFYQQGSLAPFRRVLVLAAGPGAGFALMALILLGAWIAFRTDPIDALALIRIGPGDPFRAVASLPTSPLVSNGFLDMLYINFWWGVLNLLPVWPLDGGQITQLILGVVFPRSGVRWSHVIALLTAVGIAAYFASDHQLYNAFLFGLLAFINYQSLQTLYQGYDSSGSDDGWRRR